MDPSVNRDQAERCLKKAHDAYRGGRLEEARRLASKSNRLCPTASAQEFLSKLNKNTAGGAKMAPKDRENESDTAARKEDGGDGGHDQTATTVKYTEEQVELVQRVLKCDTDHYSVLMVSKSADQVDIKKAYKKLALKLHPDKNHAPKSDEAFKAVSKAYSVLSDDEKRSQYDQFGEEGLRASGMNGGRTYYSHDYDEFDPDEIFRMFFGNSFNFGNDMYFSYATDADGHLYRRAHRRHHHHHHHRHHGNQQHHPSGSSWLGLCQLLPLVTILLVSLFSNAFYQQSPPPYTLHRSQLYSVKRITGSYNIPYYVQETFASEYGSRSKLRSIEKQVLEDYIWELKVSCNRHRMSGGGSVSKSCKKLEELYTELRQNS